MYKYKKVQKEVKTLEEISRDNFLNALNFLYKTPHKYEIIEKDLKTNYDFDLLINDKKFIIEHKHRINYNFSEKLMDEGIIIDYEKIMKLMKIYENNKELTPVYSSTYKDKKHLVIIYLNFLNIPQITKDYFDLKEKMEDRLKYLNSINEKPNEENLSDLFNKWCVVKMIKKTYADYNSEKIPMVKVRLPLHNNNFCKIYKINETNE